jgi:hypothetical protein
MIENPKAHHRLKHQFRQRIKWAAAVSVFVGAGVFALTGRDSEAGRITGAATVPRNLMAFFRECGNVVCFLFAVPVA